MTLYNVLTPVVALIEADTPQLALDLHQKLLVESGHEVYPEGADVFESEPVLHEQT